MDMLVPRDPEIELDARLRLGLTKPRVANCQRVGSSIGISVREAPTQDNVPWLATPVV